MRRYSIDQDCPLSVPFPVYRSYAVLLMMHPAANKTPSLTWCIPHPFGLSPVPNLRAPRSTVSPRRPRAVSRIPFYSSAATFENPNDDSGDGSLITPLAKSSSQSYKDVDPSLDPVSVNPSTSFSILTDSVLEKKWQDEANRKGDGLASPGLTDASAEEYCNFSTYDDISASDPYKAFARFTRIAAPTAALGDTIEEEEKNAHLLEPKLPDGTSATSYSTASIVTRLLWYTRARQNMSDFVTYFCGDFDNAHQIAEERAQNISPGEGGGHEHIHCTICPIDEDMLFARYYFNGDPSRVFRTRVYAIAPGDPGKYGDRGIVEMRIFRLYGEAEQRLRESGYDLSCISWGDKSRQGDDVYEWMRGCEVFWERYKPESVQDDEARRVLGISGGDRFIGFMKGGGCEVFSNIIGQRIHVMDDLLLTSEDLWVADRGFDESGEFVYGNRKGIPYKMRRVVEGGPLSWTMSPTEMAPEGYIP